MKVKLEDEIKHYRTVWMEGTTVKMINQHLLPDEFKIHCCNSYLETVECIRDMTVRGAGAIGATAGYAIAQAAVESFNAAPNDVIAYWQMIKAASQNIERARPTANALFDAVDTVYCKMSLMSNDINGATLRAVTAAQEYADADADACKAIGNHGADLVQRIMLQKSLPAVSILTHCNAGWLAFVDYGSALSPIYELKKRGIMVNVLSDETRPYNQGSRLTAWELSNEGVDVEIIPDNHVGAVMAKGLVDLVIVGADRIAANGSTANKIGTYTVALSAHQHMIPFYVAAPLHTFDFSLSCGREIPIEKRSSDEVKWVKGVDENGVRTKVRIAPKNVNAMYLSFDVTPYYLINGFITPKGVLHPMDIAKHLAKEPEKAQPKYGRDI